MNMQESSWPMNEVMLPNGAEMAGVRNQNIGPGVRSQDDAKVGYFFQRPQTDMNQQFNQKRWAVGDDSVIEHARNVNELERDFQQMGFEHRPDMGGAKKMWDDGKGAGDAKGIFPGPWSREDGWNAQQHPGQQHPVASQGHAGPPPPPPPHQGPMHPPPPHQGNVPPHLRRPGSFPGSGDFGSVLSPRSSETGALGVNMAEYVLGGSPVGNRRMVTAGEQAVLLDKQGKAQGYEVVPDGTTHTDPSADPEHKNGIIQNGLEEEKFRVASTSRQQDSPREGELVTSQAAEPQRALLPEQLQHAQLQHPGLHLETGHLEPVGLEPFAVDYASQLGMPSMDSPNFTDYSQLQQRPVFLTQQYLAAQQQQQQQQLAATTQGLQQPYVFNPGAAVQQDPYLSAATGIPAAAQSPALVPQYTYGIQPQWGMYPGNAGLLAQQGLSGGQTTPQGQGQVLRGQTPRSLTPSQQSDGLGTPTGGLPQTALHTPGGTQQYQILPAYYDQNGQLVMGNGRGMGTPVRLVSPAPMLLNPQQSAATGPIQIMTNQQGHQFQVAMPLSQDAANQKQMDGTLYHPAAAAMHSPGAGAPLGIHHGGPGTHLSNMAASAAIASGEASNSTLDALYKSSATSLAAASSAANNLAAGGNGLAATTQLQYSALQNQLHPNHLVPNAAGSLGGLVQAPLTPPPSLTAVAAAAHFAAAANPFGGLNASRIMSAAPGTGRIAPAMAGSNIFGSPFMTSKFFPKSATMAKEVTGRSRLLEDFRNNRIPNPQLKDLANHVVEFSQDQHGSRFIQQKLERATPSEKTMVFNEILTSAYSLMTDVFGNYVIQKFFEFGTQEQKQTLAQRLRGHVLPLALQMYGCRVIQKALESIPSEMQTEIVKELDGHVLKCVKDQNGNHVVQKCIECVEAPYLQFIIDSFKGQVFSLSTHPYGCRVMQRIMEHCAPEQVNPILEELLTQTERLVQDQYGNYVIQHVLEHGRLEDKMRIIQELRGRMLVLSQHKFASNVVEKCVAHSGRPERALLIEEVCGMNDGALFTMMKDQFANYVIQKMIDVAEPQQRKMLLHKIRPHVTALRKFTYGKHILAKLEKFYMKSNQELGPIGMPPNGSMPGAM